MSLSQRTTQAFVPADDEPAWTQALFRVHAVAALAMVGYVALLGLAVAVKFSWPELMAQWPELTWGRLRYAHTQGVFFGWLGNAFLAFCYHAVPNLAGRRLTSRRLGWVLFWLWNYGLVLPGWVLVQSGRSQPLEWGEFPLEIDLAAVVCLLLACVQFVLPLVRTPLAGLYVSAWYIAGGLVFTLLAYPVGNLVPEFEPGARGAAYSGLWIHDAIGLFVTPLALAVAYVVIPATTRTPIFSHFLSMLGFWLLFLVYPLNGTHHYLFSSIPMEAQMGAVVASVYLGVDVILVVANLLLSLRGSSGLAASDPPLRFVWTGVVCYLIVSMQGSLQALMPVNRLVHFSDWVIGHAHLALLGFASFCALGGLLFAWSRTPGLRFNARAASWAFWLLALGMTTMVVDLTCAGLVQGRSWQEHLPWLESVRASRIYWLVRAATGVPILLGLAAVVLAMATGPISCPASEESPGPALDDMENISSSPIVRWLHSGYVVASCAGVGFFGLSFFALAFWPNLSLGRQMREDRPSGALGLSSSERRGRTIYIREGCVNCHSQLVRRWEGDVRRFGPASEAWESAGDLPQLWGTRRVGPDLAREHGKRSLDWQLSHLLNPRSVVPDSIMPGYPWLFDGSSRPTREAHDLIAYLESLGRDAAIYGLAGDRKEKVDAATEQRMGMFCDCAIPRTVGPAILLSTDLSRDEARRYVGLGSLVFLRECSGCHGAAGRGDGPAAPALLPHPRDLATARFSDRLLSNVLWQGVKGSSMSGFAELPIDELRALAVYVQSLEQPAAAELPLTPTETAAARDLFLKTCSSCHGEQGDGQGHSATSLAPAPASFRLLRPTREHAMKVIRDGVPGTAMPASKSKLEPHQQTLLAAYIRTLYDEDRKR